MNMSSKPQGDCETPSVTMSLRSEVASETAAAAIYGLAERISRRGAGRKPLPNRVKLLAAFVADLLKGAAFDPVRPCYRPMGAANFTSGPFGYHSFKGVLDDLAAANLVRVERGWQDPVTREGRVTRIHPTDTLLSALAALGLTPANRSAHFAQRSDIPLISNPIRRRERSTRTHYSSIKHRGKPMSVDRLDPKVVALAAEVTAINEFLAKQTYEGMAFDGLFRGFNNGNDPDFRWNKGGRLYAVGGGYQSMEQEERKLIRINGEATAEVDISGSHPTILHALMQVELPDPTDAYAVPGLDRDAVKLFVTSTIGYGKVPTRWSKDTVAGYLKRFKRRPKEGLTGNLRKDYPFRKVRNDVLEKITLLKCIEGIPYDWSDLQFIESEVLIKAMNDLLRNEIACLPIHDALIVQKSNKEKVYEILFRSFHNLVGTEPIIKVK